MKIIKLSDCNAEILKQLARLDEAAVDKYGLTFSDETWGIENFSYPLPGKSQMSAVMLNDDGNAVGYYILSQKMGFVNYMHRFVVNSEGNKELSGILLSHMIESFPKICCQVSASNLHGIGLYIKYGFSLVTHHSELYPHYPITVEEFNAVIDANKAFLVRDA